MDLSDLTRSITPTLDGPVLAVLAAAGKPLTVGQVAEQASRGSEIGIRRCVARLVEQGTVRATQMGRNQVLELNRDHVAAKIAVLLADLRLELWERLRAEVDGWSVKPLVAAVFGSAARGDGDAGSDIDLLLVHPPLPGERRPQRLGAPWATMITDALGKATLATERDSTVWESQLDTLRDHVELWTGNPLQIVDLAFSDWRHPDESQRTLLGEVDRDGVVIRKALGASIWPSQR